MVVILQHSAGNIFSIERALKALDAEYTVASSPEEAHEASRIILPGVGHFGAAVTYFKERGLDQFIKDAANSGIPILGICLGMHVLYESSEEDDCVDGLGLLKGHVEKKSPSDTRQFKVPHVGWNDLEIVKPSVVFPGSHVDESPLFYFSNSYGVKCQGTDRYTSKYSFDEDYVSSVENGSIIGLQFHPEKSGFPGLELISSFLTLSCSNG